MIRFFKIVVASVVFVALSSFFWIFQSGVTITAEFPDVIEAGAEITVNVSINKGNMTGFARYQQDLPEGLIAMPLNSANAAFSFQDQKVRLNWLRVPEDNVINFSYKIIANERLRGRINLEGHYSYVDNNERKDAMSQAQELAIKPSPNVPVDRQVDIRDFAKVNSLEQAEIGTGQTVAFRQQPSWNDEDKIFLVTLLVNKDAMQKFAKIEETIPAGYTAANIDSKGGVFEFKNSVAKINWMDLPVTPYFTVTYKLIPEDDVRSKPALANISGLFTFIISERTFSSPIIEREETLASLNSEQLAMMLRDINEKPTLVAVGNGPSTPIWQPPGTSTPSVPPGSTGSSGTSATTGTTTGSTGAPGSSRAPGTPELSRPSGSGFASYTNNAEYLLKPETGVKYRVQIAAGRKEVNIQGYFRGYRLEQPLKREEHDGWFKYTVGPFDKYREARDLRVNLWNNTTFKDAFVVAHNNGKRITVQEALMALNEKWTP